MPRINLSSQKVITGVIVTLAILFILSKVLNLSALVTGDFQNINFSLDTLFAAGWVWKLILAVLAFLIGSAFVTKLAGGTASKKDIGTVILGGVVVFLLMWVLGKFFPEFGLPVLFAAQQLQAVVPLP